MKALQGAGVQAFGTAGRVYLMPLDIPYDVTIDRLFYVVGNASNGNIRMGLYRKAALDTVDAGVLVVQSASVAQAAINTQQLVTVVNTVLTPDQYFLAIQGDNVLGTLRRYNPVDDIAQRFDQVYGVFTDPCPATVAVDSFDFVSGVRVV